MPARMRGLGEGQLAEVRAPVALRGGCDAVAAVAVEVLVEVGFSMIACLPVSPG